MDLHTYRIGVVDGVPILLHRCGSTLGLTATNATVRGILALCRQHEKDGCSHTFYGRKSRR